MSALELIKLLSTVAVTAYCAHSVTSRKVWKDFAVFRGHSWTTWLQILLGSLLVVATTALLALVLHRFGPQLLHWSWLSFLAGPDEVERGMNLVLAGTEIRYFPIVFVTLLFVNLPRLARMEEEDFRKGTRNWAHAVPRSLRFGLYHCFVGVPLFAGVALALPGLWFTLQYFKGGTDRSTLYHTAYNMVVLGVVLGFVIIRTFAS